MLKGLQAGPAGLGNEPKGAAGEIKSILGLYILTFLF